MGKSTNIFFLIGLCVFLTSCQKDIDVSFDNFESRLVINSVFSSEDVWKVDVSNSRNILVKDSSIGDVTDANVIITDLNTLEEFELFYSEELKCYSADHVPNPFGSYKIDVQHPDYKDAHAINDIPSEIEVVQLDTSIVEFEGEQILQINFNILDNGLEDNFYVWDLVLTDEDNSSILPSNNIDLVSTDANAEVVTDQNLSGQSKIFIQDNNFNGIQYETSFLSLKNQEINTGYIDPETGEEKKVKLQLRVLTVSKELFEYLKSVETFYQSNTSNTSAVNPVDIKSNVVNGLGIFGAYELTLIDLN